MNKMKNLAVLALLFLGMAVSSFAQTTTTRIFLGAAITDTISTQITVSSTTGIISTDAQTSTSPAWAIEVDTEWMQVRTVVNSTTLIVSGRGQGGTKAEQHLINALVWAGPRGAGGPFSNTDGTVAMPAPGRCTRASLAFQPVINVINGTAWECILGVTSAGVAATTSNWSGVNFVQSVSGSRPYKKLPIASTTYTALATDYIIGYNTGVSGTITLPILTGAIGKEYVIQQEVTGAISLTIATGGGGQLINGAASIVVGLGIVGNGVVPGFGGVYIYSDGSNWFARRQSSF